MGLFIGISDIEYGTRQECENMEEQVTDLHPTFSSLCSGHSGSSLDIIESVHRISLDRMFPHLIGSITLLWVDFRYITPDPMVERSAVCTSVLLFAFHRIVSHDHHHRYLANFTLCPSLFIPLPPYLSPSTFGDRILPHYIVLVDRSSG